MYHKNFPAQQRADETEQTSKPAKQRQPVDTFARAIQVLANPKADEADRLRAWLRAGIDLGALQVRDVDRLNAFKR